MIKNPLCKDDDTKFKKLAAVYAYDVNHSSPGTAEMQMQRIYNMVHDEEGCTSILLKISQGEGPFARLYEETLIPNVNGSEASSKRYANPLYSPNRSTTLLAAGEHIQDKWLRMKSSNGGCTEFITARPLSHHATSAIKEGGKALAIATKFLPKDSRLPSGVTGEDLVNFVLDEMWKRLLQQE